MKKKIADKVAIITGSGRGIGRGIAHAFASEGAKLVLVSRTLEEVEGVAETIRESGGNARALRADVTRIADVERIVEVALSSYSRVDILVNNAAIMGPVGPFSTNDMRHWADTMRINVIGVAQCCHSVLPVMINQGGGKIINLSGAGVQGTSETLSAYGTSKAAIVRFTETLAVEVIKHKIYVNALGPGQIDTGLLDPIISAEDDMVEPIFLARVRQTKAGHGASIQNAGDLAVWLASAESDGLTGRMIHATGDDWTDMGSRIPEIMASDLHTMRFVT